MDRQGDLVLIVATFSASPDSCTRVCLVVLYQVDSEQPVVAASVTLCGTGSGVDVRVRHTQQLVLYSVCVALRCSGDWRDVFYSSK